MAELEQAVPAHSPGPSLVAQRGRRVRMAVGGVTRPGRVAERRLAGRVRPGRHRHAATLDGCVLRCHIRRRPRQLQRGRETMNFSTLSSEAVLPARLASSQLARRPRPVDLDGCVLSRRTHSRWLQNCQRRAIAVAVSMEGLVGARYNSDSVKGRVQSVAAAHQRSPATTCGISCCLV